MGDTNKEKPKISRLPSPRHCSATGTPIHVPWSPSSQLDSGAFFGFGFGFGFGFLDFGSGFGSGGKEDGKRPIRRRQKWRRKNLNKGREEKETSMYFEPGVSWRCPLSSVTLAVILTSTRSRRELFHLVIRTFWFIYYPCVPTYITYYLYHQQDKSSQHAQDRSKLNTYSQQFHSNSFRKILFSEKQRGGEDGVFKQILTYVWQRSTCKCGLFFHKLIGQRVSL